MNIPEFSIKRPVLITSIVILSLLIGTVSLTRLGVEMFPKVNIPVITVSVIYPGAGPEEMENLVAKPLEEELSSISGLKRLTSRNQEGLSVIVAEFYLETDIKYAEQEVRGKVSLTRRNLPKFIEEPVILRFDPSDQPILKLAVFADLPPAELYDVVKEKIKPKLEQTLNVGAVKLTGGVRREIQIELDRNKLNRNLTSAVLIAKQLENYGADVPVGKFESGSSEVSFRTLGKFESIGQIENTVVNFSGDLGNQLTIKSLGKVFDTTEDVKTIAELWAPLEIRNDEKKADEKTINTSERKLRKAIFVDVYKQSDANTVAVSDSVKKRLSDINSEIKEFPGNPSIMLIRDGAKPIRLNIADVRESIIMGIILAVLVVYLFLGNVRSTFITGFALPNSILGAFIIMYWMDFTINVMTLLALSLSVGLLVDDAIVVRENIFRKLEEGLSPGRAAIEGTSEVLLAVIATTATVVAVFLPIGFLSGMVGQFFKQFGLTVVFAMIVSLFDAIVVAPLLSAYFAGNVNKKPNFVIRKFGAFQDSLEHVYGRLITFSIDKPWSILILAFAVLFISIFSMRFVKNTFMPPNDTGEYMVNVLMPPGTSLAGTQVVVEQIRKKLEKIPEMNLIYSITGTQEGEANTATIGVSLIPYEKRKRNTSTIKEETRSLLKEFKFANPSVSDYSAIGGVQYPFTLYIRGEKIDDIAVYIDKIIPELKKISDLTEIDSDYRPGKPEFQVRMDTKKMQNVGVMPAVAGAELRFHVAGNVVGKFHDKGLEYDIRLRLQKDQRNLRKSFNETKVPNMQFRMIPIKEISRGVDAFGPEKINRQDRSRVVMIHANLAPGGAIGNATDAAKKFIDKNPPPQGIGYKFVGQSEDMRELMANILLAFGLALVFIYLVLASLYESFITPVTILIAIPPAISGAFLGLAITGEMMNIFSMIGIILLMGLVTKNSILLVDYAVEGMKNGMTRADAIYHAGKVRLRPILMTSLAMIAGTLPVALGLGEVAKMRKSMGIAIVGGLIVSTLITLIVVPAIFNYVDRFREAFEGFFRKRRDKHQ